MSWNERLISEDELSRYLDDSDGHGLGARVAALIRQQRETWPMLRQGYDALAQIETRRVPVAETEVILQHNPMRIRSTAAATDKRSVAARPCFLCADNLPAEEKAVAYGDDLVLVCNPFPILANHLTITHREHVEQKIEGNFEKLLWLAEALAPDYFTLYNGPECGASAPDHLHFQACLREALPVDAELRKELALQDAHCEACAEQQREGFEMFTLSGFGRSVVVLRGNRASELADWAYQVLACLAELSGKREAMVNIICTHDSGVWTVYVFPRTKHRPSAYYEEGDGRLIVSPGAIDMAGVVVVPDRDHFMRIDSGRLEEIFAEVSLGESVVDEMLERLAVAEEGF